MTDETTAPSTPLPPSAVVFFGNTNPQMQVRIAEPGATAEDVAAGRGTRQLSIPHPILNQSVTRIELQPDILDEEYVNHTLSTDNDRVLWMIAKSLPDEERKYAVAVQHVDHTIDVHAAGQKPAWVSCPENPELAQALGVFYSIPVGEPEMLLTNGGRDAVHAQNLSTSAQPAAFNYVALTASTVAPAATDTTLTGEIATAGGGLIRKQVTYAHTAGTNTSTLTGTFTANGTDVLPVTIAQIGVFNASSAGTLGYHTALSSTATLSASGDNVTITETVTAG